MRVAAILGPGASSKDLKLFQEASDATWLTGLPAARTEADAILIFGGDGTVHRHLPDLVRLQLPILVVPCGSGNDFARALGFRGVSDSLAAWRRFVLDRHNLRVIDLGVITSLARTGEASAPQPDTQRQFYFCTVGGVGLDSEAARRANRLPRWMRGNGGYALALLLALFKYAPAGMKISHSAQPPAEQQTKPIFLAAFANAPAYGGGMKIAPRALLDDGKLDICVIHKIDKLKLICLFPTVYFGRHLNVAEVEYFQTARVILESEKPLDVYADGEFVCRTPIEVSVARGALSVIVPPSRAPV
jgi:diacylglycerol kinase (ATP)